MTSDFCHRIVPYGACPKQEVSGNTGSEFVICRILLFWESLFPNTSCLGEYCAVRRSI